MSRILLLLLFSIWELWTSLQDPANPPTPAVSDFHSSWTVASLITFLSMFLMLVVVMGLWSRMLARRVTGANLHRSLRYFNKLMFAARLMIPLWFAFGLFALHWGWVVRQALGPLGNYETFKTPSILLGTLPPLLAWLGLIWSQYPADRALREQNMLAQLDEDLPIHASPGFWSYFGVQMRLQVLFTVIPVLLIIVLWDLFTFAVARIAHEGGAKLSENSEGQDAMAMIVAVGLVFIFAPEILRRVLQTEPLPDGPLRRRLLRLAERQGVRCRDILLWRTQHNMGNAAVMGILPKVRYVMLSDLLIETMSDEQIEAVFAHELGHVVHRHMTWFIIFFAIILLAVEGPGHRVEALINATPFPAWLPGWAIISVAGTAAGLLLFGFLSRRFERQADVFAARTIQESAGGSRQPSVSGFAADSPPGAPLRAAADCSYVGPHGAAIFASALQRVAIVNNIPLSAGEFFHGSISSRMAYLKKISADPRHTSSFDKLMSKLYMTLLCLLCACAGWILVR